MFTARNQKEDRRTCVDDLPDECLTLVSKFLKFKSDRDAFALTCRHWLQIESASRHSVEIHFAGLDNPDGYQKLLLRLSNRFPFILSLSLAGCMGILDSSLEVLQSGWSQLENLSLYCCLNLDDAGLEYVGIGCGALKSLSLYRCKVSDRGVKFIGTGCPHLEILDISYCQNITDMGVAAVAEGCPKLSKVNISNCGHIEGWGLRNCFSLAILEAESSKITDAGLCQALQGCTALHQLNMGNIRSGICLGPKGLSCIGLLCKSLHVLCLRMCRVLDDSAVRIIAQGCLQLENWNMAVCPEVRFEGWEAVAVFSKNLKVLHASRCRNFCDRSLLALKLGCPSLINLYLHGCPRLSAVAMQGFLQGRNGVQIFPFECME